jgi:hypothetical protein
MAKVIGPLHSTEARGVIGGLIYNTWRGIRYVKRMTSPAQPRTLLALDIRAKAITLVRAWQSLSATTRSDWGIYAFDNPVLDWTGIAKRLTGCNWYVGLNTRLLKLGFIKSDIPPAAPAPPAIVSFSATGQVAGIRCIWESPGGTGTQVIFYLHGPHSKGRQAKFPQARYKANTNAEVADFPLPVTQIGHYTVWAMMMSEANGLVSTMQVRTADVTTLV